MKRKQPSGETNVSIKDGRLKLEVRINHLGNFPNIESTLQTIIHETFIHARQFSYDFADNQQLDGSYFSSTPITGISELGYNHHKLERNDYRYLEKYGLPIMKVYYKKAGKNVSTKTIIDSFYNYRN